MYALVARGGSIVRAPFARPAAASGACGLATFGLPGAAKKLTARSQVGDGDETKFSEVSCSAAFPAAVSGASPAPLSDKPCAGRRELESHEQTLEGGEGLLRRLRKGAREVEEELKLQREGGGLEEALAHARDH